MESFSAILIPLLVGALLIRLLLTPMRLVLKLGIHVMCGLLCLWLLNSVSAFTGVFIPVNAVTALIAGVLGVPGIGIMTVLELLPMG